MAKLADAQGLGPCIGCQGSSPSARTVQIAQEGDLSAVVGDFVPAVRDVAPTDARIVATASLDDLWPLLAPRLARDAVILLKASRGMKLERLVPQLTAWATA